MATFVCGSVARGIIQEFIYGNIFEEFPLPFCIIKGFAAQKRDEAFGLNQAKLFG